MKKLTTADKQKAYDFGKKAFEKGIRFAPCLDSEFIKVFVEGTEVGESIAPMKQWHKGWTDANLAAPLN